MYLGCQRHQVALSSALEAATQQVFSRTVSHTLTHLLLCAGAPGYTTTQRTTLDVSLVSASLNGSSIMIRSGNTAEASVNGRHCLLVCAGSLDYTITQRTTLEVSLVSASAGGSLIIIGGSNTAKLQEEDVTDLTLQTTTPSTSLSWINQSYTGFSYTPKLAKYPACGSSGTQCTFAFYVVDAATLTGSKGKACRFSMEVVIDPMTLPAINASQLYNVNAAPVAVAKAPLALLALLAVPMLLVLAL